MSGAKAKRKGAWVWVASGAAIVDHEGEVKGIALLASTLDDLSVQRTRGLLERIGRRMEIFSPSDFCETGSELIRHVEVWIARARSGVTG
jgi:hypothetical protein